MRIRRSLPILLAVMAVAAAVTLAVLLRKHAPPEAARLLPGADGFLYVNLQWMRRANLLGELPQVPHDPDYEQFVQATGFQFERDLHQAAVAIHYASGTPGTAAGAEQTRFSEVFVGRIQGERLGQYLRKISSSVDSYRTVEIYSIPIEGRTVRVVILGVDTVAASNHPDPRVIRGIVDRSRKLASPFGGPALLRQYYKHLPLASLAWAIFRVQPETGLLTLNTTFLFSKPAVILASVRYLGAVHFRVVAYTSSEDEAKRASEQATTFLNLFHTAEQTVGSAGSDPDVKGFFDSLKIEQQKDRATVTATVPVGLIRKALAEAPAAVTPQPQPRGEPALAPSPKPEPKKHGKSNSR